MHPNNLIDMKDLLAHVLSLMNMNAVIYLIPVWIIEYLY